MKRKLIAAVWVTGATVPLLLATVFLVGCCVLPFHAVMHKLMPICEMAANVIRGDHVTRGHDHEAPPATPAREKQEPAKRVATEVPNVFRLAVVSDLTRTFPPTATNRYRSFITLGAIRCDQDIGLHALVETFLI